MMNSMIESTTIESSDELCMMVPNEPYMVSMYTNKSGNPHASFFHVPSGTISDKRLSRTWANPPLLEGQTKLQWYEANIASVLLKSRGPENTPARPPKRKPPQVPNNENSNINTSELSNDSSVDLDLSAMSRASRISFQEAKEEAIQKLKALEESTKLQVERHETEMKKLREEMEMKLAEKQLDVKRTASEALVLRQLLESTQSSLDLTEKKACVGNVEFKAQTDQLKEELEALRCEARAKQDELVQTIEQLTEEVEKYEKNLSREICVAATTTSSTEVSPSKRAKIERDVWTEAEKVLGMARSDVKDMVQRAFDAEAQAQEKQFESQKMIAQCEKLVDDMAKKVEESALEKNKTETILREAIAKIAIQEKDLTKSKQQLIEKQALVDELTKYVSELLTKTDRF